ncbi:hypothetical protein NEIG_02573 [Nematocida sp. ERTm5]|nr:hypothetical protein NEIG_02573 [Nematocida sp. ERTm5]
MKLEKTNRVMKNILFIPRMKNGMIILKLLVMMYTVFARLELSDIKTIGETKVIEENNLLIHPDGPLNPLRGYIMHKSGYMYNKRFYAPEIDTMYRLEKTGNDDDGIPIYKYERNPVNDKVYDDICMDTKKNKYLTQFHTLLIKMFPSTDGSLSIVSGRQDSIYSFLVKDRVKPECMRIMAALFLMSEQVDISFTTKKKKKGKILSLKSADGITTYIELPRTDEILLRLIDFLKEYINNDNANPSEMEALPSVPTTYKEFETGEFLSTFQFLVQSYIYEFIDKKENYIEFVEAVYTLLNDQIINEKSTEENKARCNELLKKCFVKEDKRSKEINHTAVICDLKGVIDKYKIFPFMDSSQLPSYTRVKAYDREKDEFINDESRKYSNCVETALLGLLLCLVYDPETKKYNADYLSNNEEAKSLKDFFRKYTEPTEVTDYTMHQDWCRVIAGLKNDKIHYKKEKNNELKSSLLNILYVVSDITGNKKEVVNEIKKIEELLADKKVGDKIDIEESLTTIFKELSNNKNLEIVCGAFTVGKRHDDNNLHLFGVFKITYTFNERINGISIGIDSGHSSISLLEDSLSIKEKNIIKEKLTEIQNTYSNVENYTACTIRQYINLELAKIEKESALDQIQESIRNNHDNINDIFLHGMILSVDQKASIVTYFLTMHVNNNLSKNNSLVRFTNNLIGSTPLDDLETRNDMLLYCVLNRSSKGYYAGIESCWEEVTTINESKFRIINRKILVESNYPQGISLECFKKLMMIVADSDVKYDIVPGSSLIIDIVKFSRKTNEPTKRLLELINIVDETVIQPDGSNMFCIYLRWIVNVILHNLDDKEEIIKILMDQIDVNYSFNRNNKWDYMFLNHFYILKYLKMNKVLLCNKETPKSVEKYNCIMNKINSATQPSKKGFFQSILNVFTRRNA